MSTRSTKPYLARALWEWCSDQGLTPLIHVQVDKDTRVPPGFVQDGQIVLNVGAGATRNLTMNNEEIRFSARFSGVSHEISVPWSAVTGLFARETGEGMLFGPEDVEGNAASPSQEFVAPESAQSEEAESSVEKSQKRPTLTVIK